MVINQGDIYWIRPDGENGGLGRHPHPYVVVQEDLFNHSRIHTVVVCALSTNLGQANQFGNVLLDTGEGDLPKQSVVVVSKISSVPKSRLGSFVGRLTPGRIAQILGGLRLLQNSFMK